jgi:hypothetical protein
MKILKNLLLLAFAAVSTTAYSQSNCENEKQDLAQIVSGSYKCEISTIEYGTDGEYVKSQGIVSITKIGENKIKISYGSISYTISNLSIEENIKIVGEEPSIDNNGSKSINLNVFEKPAVISGRSSNGTSEKEKKSWSFEGISDAEKPKSLNGEPACKEIYVKPVAEFGGKIIKKREVPLCILGKLGTPLNTLSVKKASNEQQISGVLVLETPFPEDDAWKNNTYEAQTKRYWEEINRPFINDAIAQNADIRWIVDPRLDKYKYAQNPKDARFNTTKDGKNVSRVLSYTHFEYQYLLSKGYTLDSATGIMKK